METAASEINGWRDTIERLGIGGLIVVCLFIVLLKVGKFLGPLLTLVVSDFRALIADLRSGHGEIKEGVTTMATCMKESAQSSVRLKSVVPPIARLLGMAASGTPDPKEADRLVDVIHEAVK